MPQSYSAFSSSYDAVDLIHGKFLPSVSGSKSDTDEVRIFINVYGTFADLLSRFAFRYDKLEIPSTADACILDPEYIKNNLPKPVVEAIIEEDGFWEFVDAYPWYMLLMAEIYKLCGGRYYLLLPYYDAKQLDHRLEWVWRHFGEGARDKTILVTRHAAAELFIHNRNDLYIGGDLSHCEAWANNGGSAFWWPAIDGKCSMPAKILSKRVKLLSQVVADLRELSGPSSKKRA